jgi:hypothetical protein
VALSPPVVLPIVQDFHPQDILALGLGLFAVACARRSSWIWGGVMIGLALSSQQFALLIAIPLFVAAPAAQRLRFALVALGTAAVIDVPILLLTSGRALRAILLGTGFSPTFGDTVLQEVGLHGNVLTDVARVAPLLASLLLSSLVVRRFGAAVLEPTALISLIATSLFLRLVFELNLWGYYLLSVSVLLILLDVVRGHIRGTTIAWLALATLVFNPVLMYSLANGQTYDLGAFRALQIAFIAVALLIFLFDLTLKRVHWYLVAWLVLSIVAYVKHGWMYGPSNSAFPTWFWQLVLVSTGIWLAAGPIFSRDDNHEETITTH